MTNVGHELRLSHRRLLGLYAYSEDSTDSDVEVTVTTTGDLVEAVRELLSRMPNDVYAAFRIALVGPTND